MCFRFVLILASYIVLGFCGVVCVVIYCLFLTSGCCLLCCDVVGV